MEGRFSSSLLFVYGTLLLEVPSPMSRFLQDKILSSREVSVPGYLYDLGQYPGFVYQEGARERVFGQILELRDPVSTFQVLDEYEGLQAPEPEYARILLPMEPGQAWTYLYQGDVSQLPKIEGGNYRSYFRDRRNHLRFISGK